MATFVYIDGFNFYKGRIERTPYKWLDLETFADVLLPDEDVVQVRYFTAKVNGEAAQRQEIYLRALSSLDRVSVHFGHFKVRRRWARPFTPVRTRPRRILDGVAMPDLVYVEMPEEKGSDVNFATFLVADGFRSLYDTAVVKSNDSDLRAPVEMVRDELGLRVGIVNPRDGRTANQLRGNFSLKATSEVLAAAQLPDPVDLGGGRFVSKPESWRT